MVFGVIGISGCTDMLNQTNTYSNNNISFNYPSTWYEGASSTLLKGQIVAIIDPNSTNTDKATSDNTATTYVIVTAKSMPSGSSLKNYYNQLVSQGQDYLNYKLVSNKEFTLDGKPAYEIIFTSDLENKQKSTTREIIIERNGTIYTIECISADDISKNAQNFDMIINSFKVQ